jgi:hypothetical protein
VNTQINNETNKIKRLRKQVQGVSCLPSRCRVLIASEADPLQRENKNTRQRERNKAMEEVFFFVVAVEEAPRKCSK